MIVKSSSSGVNGWSRLSGFLHCSALAAENRQRASSGQMLPLMAEETTDKGNKPHPRLVGSLYGELAQSYLRGAPAGIDEPLFWDYGLENVLPQDLQKTHPATVKEALRLYHAYTKEYTPSHLGKVLATEFAITIPGEVFNLPFDITGSIDVVVETPLGAVEIVDLKTESAEGKNLWNKFSIREQLWLYDLGYELATGVKPTSNRIDCCVKTKEPKFRQFEYEALTDRRMRWLRHQVALAHREMQDPQPRPSVQNCDPYGTPCVYLQNGMCSLIT